ncbi:protein kinase domain-containing protein [Gordonia crocea]|uniref:Protein kinase domain-containing protein n=1 Tax=Gordonia crocea TaxID=589162 RepID=A0A7M4BQ19_9ACTN|nr:protein kinase family protein [Gordonia crocea]GED95980.1 hypothetical protein nbrc107697_00190 [Gordonia crocea]
MTDPTRLDNTGDEPRSTRLDGAAQPAPTSLDGAPAGTRLDAFADSAPGTRLDNAFGATAGGAPNTRVTVLPSALDPHLTPIRTLGQGGEGTVYLCVDNTGLIEQGEHFAVKVYSHGYEPEFAIPFATHEFAAQFPYEHAVVVYRRAKDPDGRHYDVMEYCAPGTLVDFLDSRPDGRVANHTQGLSVLHEIATALHAIQEPDRGVRLVHGDIKPENVLVRTVAPFDIVLTDFGISVAMTNRSRVTNNGKGTLAYSAPGALVQSSLEADWWSVGMIMFRVLVGRDYFTTPDGRRFSDTTIEYNLQTESISLDALDGVDWMSESERVRWKLLLTGLLTRAPARRWGFGEVMTWIDGGSPTVDGEALQPDSGGADGQPKTRARDPYAFPGSGSLYTLDEIGVAATADPVGFAGSLSGQGAEQFIRWVQAEFGAEAWPFSRYQNSWPPHLRAVYFLAQIAPEQQLVYRGFALNGRADLARLGVAATTDDVAAEVVAELHGTGLIGALESPQRPGFAAVDADAHGVAAASEKMIRDNGQLQRLTGGGGFDADRGTTEKRVLARLVYGPALAAKAGAAEQVVTALRGNIDAHPGAAEVDWFREIRG